MLRLVAASLLLALSACRSQPPSEPRDPPASEPTAASQEVEARTPAGPNEALVLGLRDEEGALSTLFVDDDGITLLGPGIAVPRDDGWWKLDRVRDRDASGSNSADTLYATS